jgi:hypothetical protein
MVGGRARAAEDSLRRNPDARLLMEREDPDMALVMGSGLFAVRKPEGQGRGAQHPGRAEPSPVETGKVR